MSMLRKNVLAFAVVASVLISLVPMRGRAQEQNANGLTGPTQSASESNLSLEDLENRRQQIVVASMKFSNHEQKRKFLQVYVPY
jgi:invasion protein IalB